MKQLNARLFRRFILVQINKNKEQVIIKRMLNLELVEKQRTRLYKNELRRQLEQNQRLRKNQSMQLRQRDQHQLQQKIQISNQQIKSQKQRNIYISNQLRQQNMLLANLKNHNRQIQQSFIQQIPLKGINVMDKLYQYDEVRDKLNKNTKIKLSQSYHQEDNLQKHNQILNKHQEINQDIKHLQTLKQLQSIRKKQYEDIKNKHSPQPKIGDIHKKLQQVNEQYKKSLQSFAYNGRDILDSLKRDDTKQILQKNKRVQSQLRYQIQEKKTKQSMEKHEYKGEITNIQKSILGPLFLKESNFDKRQYGSYLMKQINESDLRKSTDKMRNKQKMDIGSIFGGQCGPQRLKMIKYIDKRMGIQSDYMKQIDSVLQKSSLTTPYRVNKNIIQLNKNIQTSPTAITSSVKIDDAMTERKRDIPFKKLNEENGSQGFRERKKTQSLNISEETVKLNSSRVGQINTTPKSYLGYDLIKGTTMRYQY